MRFILIVTVLVVALAQQCQWAKSFTQSSLLNSQAERDRFMDLTAYWEGKFHTHGIGINEKSGMTYDGRRLNYQTGEPAELHFWTASSKESLHLNMATLALAGNRRARIFFHSSSCPSTQSYQECMAKFSWPETKRRLLTLLNNKIVSYNKFNQMYPGFGGQIPWILVNDTGFVPDHPWVKRTPGLDNGQLLWSLYALLHVMEQDKTPEVQRLHRVYSAYFDLMSKSSSIVFYEGEGKIRTVAVIKDVQAQPTPENYASETPCGNPCFLDDPYEGELMAFFMDLFGDIKEKDEIWLRKRAKLVSATYPSQEGPITAPRGYWFSAHEQWKYLYLPYGDYAPLKTLFINSEKIRTINSFEKKIPGMYASVTNVTHGVDGKGSFLSGYLSACGVQEVASEKIHDKDVITPYGAYSVLLANQTVGLVWYHHLLQISKMQNMYGSTESIRTDGKRICPLLTWDSKITTVVGMLGGIDEIVKDALVKDGKYSRFLQIVSREWGRVFSNIQGQNLSFKLPNIKIEDYLGSFENCKA